jgi:hypothetical protein
MSKFVKLDFAGNTLLVNIDYITSINDYTNMVYLVGEKNPWQLSPESLQKLLKAVGCDE